MKHGVVQESILGSRLFIVNINYIISQLQVSKHAKFIPYADDANVTLSQEFRFIIVSYSHIILTFAQ